MKDNEKVIDIKKEGWELREALLTFLENNMDRLIDVEGYTVPEASSVILTGFANTLVDLVYSQAKDSSGSRKLLKNIYDKASVSLEQTIELANFQGVKK